jgi:4-hydroxyphenylpyruvate dioxygenase
MSEFFPIKRFDHLEFYVGNAKQAAYFYTNSFGFTNTAYRGLETGYRKTASYVMQQGDICLVLSTGLSPDHPISQSVLAHGDRIAVIALEVPNATNAYREATSRGAVGAIPPTEEQDNCGVFRYAAIHAYGDILFKFVERKNYTGVFAPGFQPRQQLSSKRVGLKLIDHVVTNVELGAMDRWVQFFVNTMGFNLLLHFDDKTIATESSALMSKVIQDRTGRIKLPINEPAKGKGKSQIQEYLEYNNGPGIQHVACSTNNIIETVSRLKASGVQFLHVPLNYYEKLEARVGKIDEPIEKLAELGILVDRDCDGYLLQIFTQPVEDRPTLFFEIIQRQGSQGFGEGNFKALFEAIEREQMQRGNL